MRTLSVLLSLLFFGAVATAQAPAPEPYANLAQLMRGILFPNSNILFDVQSDDPAAPKKVESGSGATSTFANIYTGWPVVENSALAIAEAGNLIMLPGRLCENGRAVPVQRPDWIKYSRELVAAGRAMYKAAQSRNRELASDTTNDVAAACENCHIAYRDQNPRCVP